MPSLLTLSALFISFFITFFTIPFWIKRAKIAKLIGYDVHKKEKSQIPELGGICVMTGFLVSLLFYIATRIFIHNTGDNILSIFATITALLIATSIGFVDDILGWKIGLRARYKVALTFFIALPIVVINVGHTIMAFPFLSSIDLGVLYPLLFVPLAIIGASNGFNMLAGYNGLETGQGIILVTTLAILTYMGGNTYIALMGGCMIAALGAFYLFNKYPAKIFPGDTLTYPVGALIAIMAILGDVEKYALILFIPYFIELVLKARGRFVKESFALVKENGTLENRYERWYGLEHVAIDVVRKVKGTATEKSVVHALFGFQLFFVLCSVILYFISYYSLWLYF